jgi:Fur family ferric uptake transcriptional regulator
MGNNFRRTRQREAINLAFQTTLRPLHASEVLANAKEQVPELGLATVYRTLKLMVSEGTLSEVRLRSGATRYEPADRHHKCFFYCESCKRAFPIETPNMQEIIEAQALDTPEGFQLKHCEVTLVGACEECPPAVHSVPTLQPAAESL